MATYGAVSQKTLDNAKSEAEAARAQVARAKAEENNAAIRLGWTKITAPASGIIGKNQLNPGALISSGSSLLNTITETNDLRIAFAASERTLDGAQITLNNRVFVTDERGKRHEAVLDFIAPNISVTSGTRLMRVKLLDQTDLLPGDFARVTLMTDIRRGVYRIPQKLIRQLPDGSYGIFVAQNGKAHERIVEVDRWDGPDWIVTKGLKPDDQIIINQLVRVREGTPVKTAQPS
ncbi:Secretion protein HlyD [gut metagenome]|uniref:Secretion protein HlyD n=1 Tax=gut metagenome TaxID=749906 RepID=J9H2C9_9ZZZZ